MTNTLQQVRELIEKKIEAIDSFYGNDEHTDGLRDILSELDSLPSDWIEIEKSEYEKLKEKAWRYDDICR